MKKIIIFSAIIISHFLSYSQSKEETTEWLNQNLGYYDKYAFFNPDMSKIFFNESYITAIRNGMMLIWFIDIKAQSNKYFVVDLKDLKYVKVEPGEFVNYIFLGRKITEFVGEKLTFEGDYIFTTTDSNVANQVYSKSIRPPSNTSNAFVKSNNIIVYQQKLSDRIVKAFSHLVNLYGGKLVSKDLF
jgi:hypothetical protein